MMCSASNSVSLCTCIKASPDMRSVVVVEHRLLLRIRIVQKERCAVAVDTDITYLTTDLFNRVVVCVWSPNFVL